MDKVKIDGVDVSGCEYRSDIYKTLLADGAIKEFSNYCYISNDGCYGVNCEYKQLKRLQAENKKLKYYLNKIREDELNSMDVEWDEYITECTSTEYTNVITFVELALGERDE